MFKASNAFSAGLMQVTMRPPFSLRCTGVGRSRLHSAVRCESSGSGLSVGGNTFRVTIRKPLGLVLSEKKPSGEVFVEEVAPAGNAAKQGSIRAGDVVIRCSATVLKSGKEGQFEREGYGQRPYDNWDRIMFDCRGQDFGTVMSALGSNNERWGINDITLELMRLAPGVEAAAAAAQQQEQEQQQQQEAGQEHAQSEP